MESQRLSEVPVVRMVNETFRTSSSSNAMSRPATGFSRSGYVSGTGSLGGEAIRMCVSLSNRSPTRYREASRSMPFRSSSSFPMCIPSSRPEGSIRIS